MKQASVLDDESGTSDNAKSEICSQYSSLLVSHCL